VLDIYEEVVKVLKEGGRAALATVVESQGSSPAGASFKMLVREDGTTLGTVGGGGLEMSVCRMAQDVILSGEPKLVTLNLTEEGERAIGALCGGRVVVYIEPLGKNHTVVIYGAGHVGCALARVSLAAGYETVVVDPRPDLLNTVPEKAVRVLRDYEEDAALRDACERDHVVIVTPQHTRDYEVLRAYVIRDRFPGYLGMIGSRRKVRTIMERLAREGVPEEKLGEVKAPIGLEIGALTAGEIAVAIMAEIIAERRQRRGEKD